MPSLFQKYHNVYIYFRSLDIFNLTSTMSNLTSPLDLFNVTKGAQRDLDPIQLLDIFNMTAKVQSDLDKLQVTML